MVCKGLHSGEEAKECSACTQDDLLDELSKRLPCKLMDKVSEAFAEVERGKTELAWLRLGNKLQEERIRNLELMHIKQDRIIQLLRKGH